MDFNLQIVRFYTYHEHILMTDRETVSSK